MGGGGGGGQGMGSPAAGSQGLEADPPAMGDFSMKQGIFMYISAKIVILKQ